MPEPSAIQAYVNDETNRRFFFDNLCELLRCQSVSADSRYAGKLQECADRLACFGREYLDMAEAKVVPTAGHPCVIMHGRTVPNAPRVLIYGHYDVQPAEDLELWDTPPFEPCLKGHTLYGRGTCDDKGQFFMWLCALKTLRSVTGRYPLNITVVLEGEEEIGSAHFTSVLEEYRDELKADAVIISDTSSVVKGVPVLHYSLRGVMCFEVRLRTAACDLHSGVHGGVCTNAPREMAQLIAKLYDESSRVTVPGFYDNVLPIEPWEEERLAKVPFNAEEYSRQLGAELYGEAGFTTNQRRWFRPTLECNGICGGYTGEGSKTIIPASCTAKFSVRLVAHQKPEKVMDCLEKWFVENTPKRAELTFVRGEMTAPYLLEQSGTGAKLFAAAEEAVQKGFGTEPLICRNGGAIGVVAEFSRVFGVPTLLLGLGSPDDRTHGPNEKFEMDNFYKGIVAGAELLSILGRDTL
ncbi:MAG: M20/M25/M40 family metallo-hydrolase [bacterium]|nr:M20/M25/M40 family metallo-hydrolase [bacterium]